MFERGGIAYVYLVYGMHHCLNVVTGEKDYPAAVLLRAAESPDGTGSASGPGRLTRAFRVDRALDGASLLGSTLGIVTEIRRSRPSLAGSMSVMHMLPGGGEKEKELVRKRNKRKRSLIVLSTF